MSGDRLCTDERLDPRFRAEALAAGASTGEGGGGAMAEAVEQNWGAAGLRIETISIESQPDSNKITLAFHRPDSECCSNARAFMPTTRLVAM